MNAGTDPLLQALDAAPAPVTFFLRDDDAGWADERLLALLDTVADTGTPIDLAVIPGALQPALARTLQQRQRGQPLGLHQHGLHHHNHETVGRKCEFGAARSAQQRLDDIRQGRRRLQQQLCDALDPIFTPPWNRVADDVPGLLRGLGFAALSREHRAPPQDELAELPVHVDWCKHWRAAEGAGDARPQQAAQAVAQALAEQVGAPGSAAIGLMLHHAVMDDGELGVLAGHLRRWTRHPNARWQPMRALINRPSA